MRTIMRIDAYPPDDTEADAGRMFALMLRELRETLCKRWPEWYPSITTVVGYEDDAEEAYKLLGERWVCRQD